jgi:hypothetical protein
MYKPEPPQEAIQALADEFRADWRTNAAIAPWLRKHGPRLQALVKEEWTWEGIGKALTAAGIAYKTGKPWRPEILRKKIGNLLDRQKKGTHLAKAVLAPPLQAEGLHLPMPAAATPALPIQAPQPASPPRLHKIRLPATKKIREPPRPRTPEEETEYQRHRVEVRRKLGLIE